MKPPARPTVRTLRAAAGRVGGTLRGGFGSYDLDYPPGTSDDGCHHRCVQWDRTYSRAHREAEVRAALDALARVVACFCYDCRWDLFEACRGMPRDEAVRAAEVLFWVVDHPADGTAASAVLAGMLWARDASDAACAALCDAAREGGHAAAADELQELLGLTPKGEA